MKRMTIEFTDNLLEEIRAMVTISGAHIISEEEASDNPLQCYHYDSKTGFWAAIRKLIASGNKVYAGYNGDTEEYWIKAKKTGDQ